MSDLTVLDLFSAAAGGWSLGAHRAGFRTIAAAEKVDWRRTMYSHNNPGVTVYEDVRDVTAERLLADHGSLPWCVLGSPPCQDISSANTKGRGVDGDESGLFFEAIRIVVEIRALARERGIAGARWFALENSDRVRTRGFDRLAAAMEAHGHGGEPLVVGTGNAGASHQRKRAWWIGLDAHAARTQRGAAGQPWVDAHADGPDRALPRPDRRRWGWSEETGRGTGDPMGANADRGQLRVECRPGPGRQEVGQEEVVAGLARVFRGPIGAASLSSHIRAYDGLPAGLAEQCREAYGDAVSPQVTEAICRSILRTETALAAVLGPPTLAHLSQQRPAA